MSFCYLLRFCCSFVQKIFKQGAVTDHRFAEILSVTLTLTVSKRYLVSDAVVFYDTRMIYREIGGILIKVAHRIAAALHYVLDQSIGMIHSGPRIVHKSRLLPAPIFGIPASGPRP